MAIKKVKGLAALLSNTARGFKNRTKSFSGAAKTVTAAAAGGAVGGLAGSPAGLKGEGTREGALVAGTVAAAATIGTKIVFRRFRGRIVPIRVKNG